MVEYQCRKIEFKRFTSKSIESTRLERTNIWKSLLGNMRNTKGKDVDVVEMLEAELGDAETGGLEAHETYETADGRTYVLLESSNSSKSRE